MTDYCSLYNTFLRRTTLINYTPSGIVVFVVGVVRYIRITTYISTISFLPVNTRQRPYAYSLLTRAVRVALARGGSTVALTLSTLPASGVA